MKRLWLTFILLVAVSGSMIAQDTASEDEQIIFRSSPPVRENIQFDLVAEGFDRPLYITHAGDGTNRLYVLEQGGKIWMIENGLRYPTPFLDVTNLLPSSVNSGAYSEQGLLGIAFHPNFEENGQFFIDYNDSGGATVVARYQVYENDPTRADPNSAQTIFFQPQPFVNHSGGHIDFGQDGYLYISLGDGGSVGDPLGSGQNPATLLGSILRIDVNGEFPYSIPPDNPFVNDPEKADEIWSYGLRNVWRFSFDRLTNDMYLADVGQWMWEEVNFQSADSTGGENYGWNILEGTHPYSGAVVPEGLVNPIAEYNHDSGCSITGGYVYRGNEVPELQGAYIFGDFCSGNMWTIHRNKILGWQMQHFDNTSFSISSFGEDESGELYVVDYNGRIMKFASAQ